MCVQDCKRQIKWNVCSIKFDKIIGNIFIYSKSEQERERARETASRNVIRGRSRHAISNDKVIWMLTGK
jgi:hypothetical protein